MSQPWLKLFRNNLRLSPCAKTYPRHIYNANASSDQGNSDYVPFLERCTAYALIGSVVDTISQCTSSQCNDHFGAICTGHADLVDTTCFCDSFNIEPYFKQCNNSVIRVAQLYRWFSTLCQDARVQWSNKPANLTIISNPKPVDLKACYKDANIRGYAPPCLQSEAEYTV